MAFAKGQSGNPGGRPKVKAWRDALERAVNAEDRLKKRPRLELIAEACIDAAISGDVSAMKEIGDRLDGKVPQGLVGDDDAPPIRTVSRIELVDLAARTSSDTGEA